MRIVSRFVTVAILALPATLRGNDRVTDLVRVQTDRDWSVNQHVCFERENSILACGTVVATHSYLITVRAPKLAHRVHRGDKLVVAPYGMGRDPASEGVSLEVTQTPKRYLHSISGGALVTEQAIVPTAHFQAAITRGIVMGVLAGYGEKRTTNSVLGIFGTQVSAEFYPGGDSWDGLFVRVNGGGFQLRAEVGGATESDWKPAAGAALGWRFLSGVGLHFALFGGGQYVAPPRITLLSQKFTGLNWTGQGEIGLSF